MTPCSKLDDRNFVDDFGKIIKMTGTSAQIGINTNIAKAKIFRANTPSNIILDFKGNEMEKIENITNLGSIKLETSIHNTSISYITISLIPLDSRFIICACKFMNDHYIMMFALWLSKIQWLWKQKFCDILPSNDKCTEAVIIEKEINHQITGVKLMFL